MIWTNEKWIQYLRVRSEWRSASAGNVKLCQFPLIKVWIMIALQASSTAWNSAFQIFLSTVHSTSFSFQSSQLKVLSIMNSKSDFYLCFSSIIHLGRPELTLWGGRDVPVCAYYCPTNWLTDWLTDWLTIWLINFTVWGRHLENNIKIFDQPWQQNCFQMFHWLFLPKLGSRCLVVPAQGTSQLVFTDILTGELLREPHN